MFQDFFFKNERMIRRRRKLRELEQEQHFESLYLRSFTEMRSRAPKH